MYPTTCCIVKPSNGSLYVFSPDWSLTVNILSIIRLSDNLLVSNSTPVCLLISVKNSLLSAGYFVILLLYALANFDSSLSYAVKVSRFRSFFCSFIVKYPIGIHSIVPSAIAPISSFTSVPFTNSCDFVNIDTSILEAVAPPT